MTCRVFFISDAEKDLAGVFRYIKREGCPINAKKILTQIRKACADLSESPERGRIAPELERIGLFDFREIIVNVYRIIYEIKGDNVYIHCILDGRRDIQALLEQRMLR